MMPKLPPQFLQMIRGGNPQQVVMNLLQQNAQVNPMFGNIMELANKGDGDGVTEICKNIIRSKGYDPDELMQNFQSQFK